jgi:hypothetical protein
MVNTRQSTKHLIFSSDSFTQLYQRVTSSGKVVKYRMSSKCIAIIELTYSKVRAYHNQWRSMLTILSAIEEIWTQILSKRL